LEDILVIFTKKTPIAQHFPESHGGVFGEIEEKMGRHPRHVAPADGVNFLPGAYFQKTFNEPRAQLVPRAFRRHE
jgi:hypothetical protein